MKHSSPISLFSFQDIITSLTGILIVIVLIIALELVETMATVAARSELLPDYLCLKQKAAELSDTKTALQQSLASNDSPQGPFADLSLPELRDLIAREKRYQALLTEKNRTEDLLYGDLVHENEKISKLSKAVADDMAALAKDENLIKELQATLLELQHRQQHIDELVERKRTMLRVSFQGQTNRQPILVECNAWGFRAKRHPHGTLTTFGMPGRQLPEQIPDLCSWLAKQDITNSYVALLIKEDAVPHVLELTSALTRLTPDLMLGKEPIGAEENCFNE